jgi:hypothetical protein
MQDGDTFGKKDMNTEVHYVRDGEGVNYFAQLFEDIRNRGALISWIL